jgi:hypothetical protein
MGEYRLKMSANRMLEENIWTKEKCNRRKRLHNELAYPPDIFRENNQER